MTTVEDTKDVLQQATQVARTNRDALSRTEAVLAHMEEAADRGEQVDAKEFATARADVELRTRRQTILDRDSTAAHQAHTAAEQAVLIELLAGRAEQLAGIIDGPREALEDAQKAYEDALVKYREYASRIMHDARTANLPTVDIHGSEDGILATVKRVSGYDDEFITTGLQGVVRVGGRVVFTNPDEFQGHSRNKQSIGNRV